LDTSASRIATAMIRPWQHNRLSLNKMPQETGAYISGTPMSIIFPLDCSFLNMQPKDLARYTANGNQVPKRKIMTHHYTSTYFVYANPKIHHFSFDNLIRTEYF
jgi:hypothetical protein